MHCPEFKKQATSNDFHEIPKPNFLQLKQSFDDIDIAVFLDKIDKAGMVEGKKNWGCFCSLATKKFLFKEVLFGMLFYKMANVGGTNIDTDL